MTVTVAAALATLRIRLDEPNAAQWTDPELRGYLNEGIRDIARRTRLYTDQNTVDVAADTGEYTLDADILAIEHLLWKADADSDKRLLEARAFKSVASWINDTGSDPIFYTTYGHPPVLKIQLFPVPTRDGTLYIYGPTLPAAIDVSGGTGNIDVIEGWLEAAIDYAEYMAVRKDMQDTRWKDIYSLYLDKVNSMIENSPTDDGLGEFTFTGAGPMPRWLTDFD